MKFKMSTIQATGAELGAQELNSFLRSPGYENQLTLDRRFSFLGICGNALASACILLALAGCASTPVPVTGRAEKVIFFNQQVVTPTIEQSYNYSFPFELHNTIRKEMVGWGYGDVIWNGRRQGNPAKAMLIHIDHNGFHYNDVVYGTYTFLRLISLGFIPTYESCQSDLYVNINCDAQGLNSKVKGSYSRHYTGSFQCVRWCPLWLWDSAYVDWKMEHYKIMAHDSISAAVYDLQENGILPTDKDYILAECNRMTTSRELLNLRQAVNTASTFTIGRESVIHTLDQKIAEVIEAEMANITLAGTSLEACQQFIKTYPSSRFGKQVHDRKTALENELVAYQRVARSEQVADQAKMACIYLSLYATSPIGTHRDTVSKQLDAAVMQLGSNRAAMCWVDQAQSAEWATRVSGGCPDLSAAVKATNATAVDYFLRYLAADPNSQAPGEESPLLVVATQFAGDPKEVEKDTVVSIFRQLLEAGADTEYRWKMSTLGDVTGKAMNAGEFLDFEYHKGMMNFGRANAPRLRALLNDRAVLEKNRVNLTISKRARDAGIAMREMRWVMANIAALRGSSRFADARLCFLATREKPDFIRAYELAKSEEELGQLEYIAMLLAQEKNDLFNMNGKTAGTTDADSGIKSHLWGFLRTSEKNTKLDVTLNKKANTVVDFRGRYEVVVRCTLRLEREITARMIFLSQTERNVHEIPALITFTIDGSRSSSWTQTIDYGKAGGTSHVDVDFIATESKTTGAQLRCELVSIKQLDGGRPRKINLAAVTALDQKENNSAACINLDAICTGSDAALKEIHAQIEREDAYWRAELAREQGQSSSGRSSSGTSGTSSTEDPFANLPAFTYVVKVYARTGGYVNYKRQLVFSVPVKARTSNEAEELAKASLGGSFSDAVKKDSGLGYEWYWDNVEVEQR